MADIRVLKPTTVKKYSVGEIAINTAEALEGRSPHDWPKYDGPKFVTGEDYAGERMLLELSAKNVVKPVSQSRLDASIQKYLTRDIPAKKKWRFKNSVTTNTVREVRNFWLSHSEPVELAKINQVSFKSDEGLTYHRIGFDPEPLPHGWVFEHECPYTADFMSRTSNAEALMTWIGSIFDSSAPRQNYVWLFGHGSDGKGTLMNCLRSLLGPSFASEQPPGRNTRFWPLGLVGKRLVAFPDMNDVDFVTSGLFKSLTGGDPIRVEQKAGAIMTMDINALYLIISNSRPNITMSKSDLRRIVFCFTRAPQKYFPNYAKKMEAEMPLFISYCWRFYRIWRQTGQPMIPTKQEETQEIAQSNNEEVATILDHHFANRGDGQYVAAERVTTIIRHYWKNDHRRMKAAYDYLKDELGAKSEPRRRADGYGRQRYYVGLWEREPLGEWLD